MSARRARLRLLRGLVPLLLCAAAACGGGGRTATDLRAVVLEALVEDVVLPDLRALDAAGSALTLATSHLAEAPDGARLESARSAWRASRRAWNRAEAVLFGPVADLLLPAQVDTSPVDEPRLDALLAGSEPISRALIERLGGTQKGFHALEYLLFDPPGGPPASLLLLTSDPLAPRRLDLVRALGEELAAVLHRIRDLWEPSGGAFATEFVTAGRGSAKFLTQQAALDLVVNHLVAHLEVLADVRLGRPLGRTSGGLAQAPGAECERSGHSRLDALDDALGVRDVYLGRADTQEGNGLRVLVAPAHPEVDAAIFQALQGAVQGIEAIPESLLDSAIHQRFVVEAAFEAVREARARVVVDLTGALGGTLTFSPFDGD